MSAGPHASVTRPWNDIHPKVAASGLAGAAVIVLVWALHAFLRMDQPPEVMAAEVTLALVAAGYLMPGDAPAPA